MSATPNPTVYYVIDAGGIYYVAVLCDLPPSTLALGTDSYYEEPYRNLPGNAPEVAPGSYIVSTPLTGTPVVTATEAGAQIVADDQVGLPFRQDAQFKKTYWIFTNSTGQLCGQFPIDQYPSFTNAGPPNTVAALPTSP